MVDWGRLLSGYWGEILSRRFESCPPRHEQKRVRDGAFLLSCPILGINTRLVKGLGGLRTDLAYCGNRA